MEWETAGDAPALASRVMTKPALNIDAYISEAPMVVPSWRRSCGLMSASTDSPVAETAEPSRIELSGAGGSGSSARACATRLFVEKPANPPGSRATGPEYNTEDFKAACDTARRTITMGHIATTERAYFDSRASIVDHVDLLLPAVWDGQLSGGHMGSGDIGGRWQAASQPIKIIWPAAGRG